MTDININIRVPAVEKLLDMTASGVGAVAAPLLMRWNSHEQAGATQRIAQAQEKARETFKADGGAVSFKAEIAFAECIRSSVRFQQEKRMANVGSVVQEAKTLLGDKDVPDVPVNPDWSARFFDDVKDVSSDQLQTIWAQILAGEVETPGRSSLRTLEILKNMTMEDAKIFENFASCLVVYEFARRAAVFNPSWSGVIGSDEFDERLMHDIPTCQIMQETGLFMAVDEDGWEEWGYPIQDKNSPVVCGIGEHWGLELGITSYGPRTPLTKIPVISAMRAGRELAGFLNCSPNDQYLACLARCLQRRGGRLFAAKIRGREGGTKLLEGWRPITGEWER